jgi:hypothetical protein
LEKSFGSSLTAAQRPLPVGGASSYTLQGAKARAHVCVHDACALKNKKGGVGVIGGGNVGCGGRTSRWYGGCKGPRDTRRSRQAGCASGLGVRPRDTGKVDCGPRLLVHAARGQGTVRQAKAEAKARVERVRVRFVYKFAEGLWVGRGAKGGQSGRRGYSSVKAEAKARAHVFVHDAGARRWKWGGEGGRGGGEAWPRGCGCDWQRRRWLWGRTSRWYGGRLEQRPEGHTEK